MAMRANGDQERILNHSTARLAGAVCAVLALLGAAALMVLMMAWRGRDVQVLAYLGGWVVVLALMAAAAVQLSRGSAPAQRLLLVFWLLVAVAAGLAELSGQLWGVGWWGLPVPLWATAGLVLAGAVAAVALVVRASVDRSPLRYASYVTVSIALAVALVIVVNLIAQDTSLHLHRDMQQLGRYGLSERTQRILTAVQSPVRLTCVYTSADEQTRGADFRPAVLELLADMRERNTNIEVANATTESAKAKIVARLRGQLGGKADKHIQFLTGFTKHGQELAKALADEQLRWGQLADDAYLTMWALSAQAPQMLAKGAQEVDYLRVRVAGELEGSGLPDYAGLVGEVTKTLSELQRELGAEARLLADIAKIPPAATANRKDALEKLEALTKAVAELNKALAAGKAEEASQALLDRSAALARDAATKALEAAKALQNVGGADNAPLVAASRYYQLAIPSGIFEVRSDLGRFLEQYVAGSLQAMAETVETVRKVAKPEYYGRSTSKLQTEAAGLSEVIEQVAKASQTALDKLTEVDEPSQQMLQAAQAGETFKDLLEGVASLLEEARKLPELASDSLATDIVGDNIVIVEVAGKTAVVPFDEVWLMKGSRWGGEEPPAQDRQRTFNGDSAIASRILAMTSEPFATVVLTYYGGPPELMRMMPPSEIAPANLSALRKRLEEANFEVKDWDLSQDRPAETPGRPQVLLVLPSPPALPGMGEQGGFGPEHVEKVTAALDAGTPAVFLTQFLWPRQMAFMPPFSPTYGFADYLRRVWGLDVKTDYLVIPALADETQPGLFRIAPARFSYLPLSTFTSHPIGKPLQAQRVLWTALAPILTTGKEPANVSLKPVLQVPASWQSTWATRRLEDLQAQLESQGAYIRPDYQAGDIAPPFAVAVAATRSGSPTAPAEVSTHPTTTATATTTSMPQSFPAAAPARIVVMTLGAGMVDGYLDRRVGQLDARNTLILADPPRANADVVINSVYWLIGREALISAGPAQVRPVAMIPTATMNLLRAIYLIGLPLGVAVAGAAVLLARRR